MDLTVNNRITAEYCHLSCMPDKAEAISEPGLNSQDKVTIAEEAPDDALMLAKRITGQYGKTETVTVLTGTDKNDRIHIADGKNGGLEISINGIKSSFTAEQASKLVIDAKAGDDIITADKDIKTSLFITGGSGNDIISGGSGNDFIIDSFGRNIIFGNDGSDSIISFGLDTDGGSIIDGGEGNNYIEGSKNADIITAGSGNNVIYGLDGDDNISAGNGRNYIDGGRGDDIIENAGAGGMLFGGMGNDSIISAQRASIIADGYGENTIQSPAGSEKLELTQAKPAEALKSFTVTGSEAFKARVQSDLDSLQHLELGQKMLSSIADTGYSVTIQETSNNGNQCRSGKAGHLADNDLKIPGQGISSAVYYNRAGIEISGRPDAWAQRPPIVGLFHEFAHSYNAATGTMDYGAYKYDGTKALDKIGLVGAEYQAVGIEHPLVNTNPDGLNENGMRSLLGIEKRTYY